MIRELNRPSTGRPAGQKREAPAAGQGSLGCLGTFTGKGYGELIRTTFGKGWAWLSVTGLGVAAVGIYAGLSGIGN